MSRLPADRATWARAAGWAIADQALFSGTSFLLNVILARWLLPDEYGAFAVGLAAMTLAGVPHVALLTEPLTVFGPGKFRDRFAAYLAATLYGHLYVSIALAVLMAVAGTIESFTGAPTVGAALLAFAAITPVTLLLWFLRRASYVRTEPQHAAISGFVYLAAVVAVSWTLWRLDHLTILTAIAAMGAAAVAADILLLWWLRPDFRNCNRALRVTMADEHWSFGRWGIATGLTYYATNQAFYLILPAVHGLQAAAALRALGNLTIPMILVGTAVSSLLGPALVRARGTAAFARLLRVSGSALLAMGVAYTVLVILLRRQLVSWAYGGRYDTYADILLVLALTVPPTMMVDFLAAVLRAMERPKLAFAAMASSAAIGLGIGTALIVTKGVWGAAAGLVVCALISTGCLVMALRSTRR